MKEAGTVASTLRKAGRAGLAAGARRSGAPCREAEVLEGFAH